MQKTDNLLFPRSRPFKLLLEKSFEGKTTLGSQVEQKVSAILRQTPKTKQR